MKTHLLYSLLVLLFIVLSCDSEEFVLNTEKGFAICQRSGQLTNWSASHMRTHGEDLFSVTFDHYDRDGGKQGTMSFSKLSLEHGLHEFRQPSTSLDTAFASYSTYYSSDDVIGEGYGNVQNDQPSWYRILTYDPSSNFVKGQFEVTLYPAEEKSIPNSPDSVRMTNGSFEIYLDR